MSDLRATQHREYHNISDVMDKPTIDRITPQTSQPKIPSHISEESKQGDSDKNDESKGMIVDGIEIKDCNICLQSLATDKDEVVSLNCNAGHIFHVTCIDEWIKRNKT